MRWVSNGFLLYLRSVHWHCSAGGNKEEEGGSGEGEFEFAAGDSVRVDLDLDSAKLLQEGHGGWRDAMNEVS